MNQSKNSTQKISIPKTADKMLINSDIEGMSRTLRSSYYKTSLANYLAPTGSCANAVLIIKKL